MKRIGIFFMFLSIFLAGCMALDEADRARIKALSQQMISIEAKWEKTVSDLYDKHKAGKLTTAELMKTLADLKGDVIRETENVQRELQGIHERAKARGAKEWEYWFSVIGALAAGAIGIPSPGLKGLFSKKKIS